MDVAELVSVREAAERTAKTEMEIRAMIRLGKLQVVRVGYNLFIPKTELRKLKA